jgi:phage gp36-like protein
MSYSTLGDFYKFGLTEAVCAGLDSSVVSGSGEAAKDLIDGYFRAAGIDLPLPSASVTSQIKRIECHIRAYDIMCATGYEPGTDPDTIFSMRYGAAIRWLEQVAAGKIYPIPVDSSGEPIDADTTSSDNGAIVASETARGWGS